METSEFSASINFLLISLFISLLNFSTNSLLSYLLSLAALLNSYTNSSIIFSSCFNFLSFAIFIDSSSSPPNSLFKLIKNSSTNLYSTFPDSNSSIIFSFHTSADSPYIYERTYYTYSSTIAPLNFILKNNLHAVINPPTFPTSLLKMASLATSI